MGTMKTISAALKLIDVKKENLRKAFEDLQAHSSSLSSFTLTWSDIDSHFTSIQSSLTHQFDGLQSLEKSPKPQPSNPPAKTLINSASGSVSKPESESKSKSVPPRPELKSFCERMDGKGMRAYIFDRPKERNEIRVELAGAFQCAPNAAAMILDAMEGFYGSNSRPNKGDKDPELVGIRRTCVMFLEEMTGVVEKERIEGEVKERAKKLAVEWKGKVSRDGENTLEALAFLHLLASYGLASEFDVEEIVSLLVLVAKYRQTTELCRTLGVVDKIPDLVQKLINVGKQLLAVRFIFEFELTDKFAPVPLLKAYLKESKKLAQNVRKKGNNSHQSLNEAMAKEVSALKSVIKYIENHNLESEYPRGILEKRIELLEKQKADRKRKPQQPQQQQPKPQQQSGSKRPRTNALPTPAKVPKSATVVSTNEPSFQPSHVQVAGLLPDHQAPYVSSSAGPYGLPGSTPAVAPYAGSSAGLYGSAGAPVGFPGNPSPARPHVYSSESHMPSGYYDRPIVYGGYGLPPQYHPSYYHQ
ncbi:hypothetical protein L1049_000457 [Liquidambar formosana]|uniref:FRIGIDA-like protein n=1 Tax=Liquidambar formosana TaxID=63359 RepID=A0AAP0N8T7_LIQFO